MIERVLTRSLLAVAAQSELGGNGLTIARDSVTALVAPAADVAP